MSGSGLLGIGLSGLLATQRALSVTSHNISNAGTEGFSRQRIDFDTRLPQQFGTSYIGNGVDVASVERVYDNFLVEQVRGNTASFESANAFQNYVSRIDNLLANPEAGVSPAIQNFFSAMHELANDPSSQPARQLLLSEAKTLTDRMQYVDDRLGDLRTQSNTALRNSLNEVNTLARGIADLNERIVTAIGASGGGSPNDLLDKRDTALMQLSKLVSVDTITQSDGSLNVFIGAGQALVVGAKTQDLSVTPNRYDPTRYEVGYTQGTSVIEISNQLFGGTIGGLLNFRSQVLDPAQNALGRVAAGLSETVNTQHKLGMDLNGALGGNLFNSSAPEVLFNSTNAGAGTVSAAMVNANDLSASDYRLLFNGGTSYTLTRLNDGQAFAIDTGGSSPYTSPSLDGFTLSITAGAAAGDTFLVRPTRHAVEGMSVAISDPAQLAAATPVRSSAALSNTGNAVIGAASVNSPDNRLMIQFTGPGTYDVLDQTSGATLAQGVSYSSGGNISYNGVTVQVSDGGSGPAAGDRFYVDERVTGADAANSGGALIGNASVTPPDPALSDAVSIVFTSPTTFNVVGATTGSPTTGVSYTSGGVISYNGWNLVISGTPAAGDTFAVGANTGGVGDNGNALLLSNLQNKTTLAGGTATYQDAYGQIVSDVGAKTREAEIGRDARNALLNQAMEARDSVSGVNLDEEAANLLKLQQAYQAAAQLVSTSNSIFQSLLDAVRR